MSFRFSIFDFNGVLVDDEAVHLAAFRDALQPHGISISEADYWEKYIGFDDREGFKTMLEDAGRTATPELVDELVRTKMPYYLERAKRDLKGFSGAAELVRARAALGPVLVVSGALRPEIEFGLKWLDVSGQIACIVAAEDTQASKPDPEGYLLAIHWLEQQGHRDLLSDTVVFEDSLAGIESAKAAGLPCIAIGHSYPMQRLEASAADLVVRSIDEISPRVLGELHDKIKS